MNKTKKPGDGRRNNGGRRPNSGRKLKDPEHGRRISNTVNLTPPNDAFLKGIGSRKNDYLNDLLDMEREKETK